MTDPVYLRLKALRLRTNLSGAKFAKTLGMEKSTYTSYEQKRYKQAEIPMWLAKDIVREHAGKGDPPILESEVMALAGSPSAPEGPASGETVYDRNERALLAVWRELNSTDQGIVFGLGVRLRDAARAIEAANPPDGKIENDPAA